MNGPLLWQVSVPQVSGYYFAEHRDPDTWLDASPEVVYLYFDGRWSVFRPRKRQGYDPGDFIRWAGPLEPPPDGEAVDGRRKGVTG